MSRIRMTIARALWWLVKPAYEETHGCSLGALRSTRDGIYGPESDCPPPVIGPVPTPSPVGPGGQATPAFDYDPAGVNLLLREMLRLLASRQSIAPPRPGEAPP